MNFRTFLSTVLAVIMLGQTNQVLAATNNVPCNTTKLIKAITDANATLTDDTINLQAGCTYTLRSVDNSTLGATGLPLIADAAIAGKMTINGNGATIVRNTGKGTPKFRILAVAIGGDLTLDNVRLRNGNLPTNNGGGISNAGSLTVSNSTISGNSADYGGGIGGQGTLTVINSLITGNRSVHDGAGINSGGTLEVTSSTFSGNVAGNVAAQGQGLGGGILVASGIATVTDSTFSGNVAYGFAGGGGILSGGCGVCGPSELTVVGSTFTNNMANGGALFNTEWSTMTVTNSTISGNQGNYSVGGIFNAGTLTVTHSTITGNISQNDGGGGISNNYAGTVTMGSTIVAGNASPSGPDLFGLITSLGYNLIGNTSDATIIGDTTGNLTDAAAVPLNLGPLQNNGGPTQTIALQAGSVAINAGDPGFTCTLPPCFDQRGNGFPRVDVGGRIDIGAYESNP